MVIMHLELFIDAYILLMSTMSMSYVLPSWRLSTFTTNHEPDRISVYIQYNRVVARVVVPFFSRLKIPLNICLVFVKFVTPLICQPPKQPNLGTRPVINATLHTKKNFVKIVQTFCGIWNFFVLYFKSLLRFFCLGRVHNKVQMYSVCCVSWMQKCLLKRGPLRSRLKYLKMLLVGRIPRRVATCTVLTRFWRRVLVFRPRACHGKPGRLQSTRKSKGSDREQDRKDVEALVAEKWVFPLLNFIFSQNFATCQRNLHTLL